MHMPHWTRSFITVALWVVLITTALQAEDAPKAPPDRAALFDAAHQIVADNFFDPAMQGVDWTAARDKFRPIAASAPTRETFADTINEMLALLHTSHTRYCTPDMTRYYELLGVFESSPAYKDQMAAVRESLPQHRIGYVGIGIDTLVTEEGTFIMSLYDGSPADLAGLHVGDRLIGVAGEPFHPIHSFESRDGQTVDVTVQRQRDGAPEQVALTPRFLEGATMFREAMQKSARIISVEEEVRQQSDSDMEAQTVTSIGYVHVWSYAGQTYQDLLVELLGGPLAEAQALVLDLRDGLGGASPEYLNLFNRDIPVLVSKMPRKHGTVTLDGQWRRPTALLINQRVTSGKEVFTWGFKRSGRGPVVGETTAGAVVAGALHFLPDNSVIYLAVADVEVDGHRLEGVGVAPTISVARTIPFCAGRDPQLDAAVEALVRELRSK